MKIRTLTIEVSPSTEYVEIPEGLVVSIYHNGMGGMGGIVMENASEGMDKEIEEFGYSTLSLTGMFGTPYLYLQQNNKIRLIPGSSKQLSLHVEMVEE